MNLKDADNVRKAEERDRWTILEEDFTQAIMKAQLSSYFAVPNHVLARFVTNLLRNLFDTLEQTRRRF